MVRSVGYDGVLIEEERCKCSVVVMHVGVRWKHPTRVLVARDWRGSGKGRLPLILCYCCAFILWNDGWSYISCREFRQFLRGCGIIVSVCGLLYGGFWRIRMRETYGLPEETWCCGYPNLSDLAQWLLCSWCSLCQEVRTAEAFDITDNRFYVKAERSGLSPDLGQDVPGGEELGFSSGAAVSAASLQPLPVSTVVRITEMALSNIRDPMLDPPLKQNVFHN